MGIDQQSNIKEMTATNTFPEIYHSLNKVQQKQLKEEIMRKLEISRQTIWYWVNRKRIPQGTATRSTVAACVKKITGVKVPQHILFDSKQ